MNLVLDDNVKEALRKAGVSTLYLFGSRAQGHNNPLSDFDFGVLLTTPERVFKSTLKPYHDLYSILASVVQPETLEADVIDIVFLDSPQVPLEIKSHIVRTGRILFEENASLRADFTSRILLQTADFASLRKQMSAALAQRPTVL